MTEWDRNLKDAGVGTSSLLAPPSAGVVGASGNGARTRRGGRSKMRGYVCGMGKCSYFAGVTTRSRYATGTSSSVF